MRLYKIDPKSKPIISTNSDAFDVSLLAKTLDERFKKVEKIDEKTLFEAKWLALNSIQYKTKEGKLNNWDYVARKNNAEIVTVICKSSRYNRFLLIAQPRIPPQKIVIEFPAGVIEEGQTPEEAADNELREETGYEGELIDMYRLIIKSAGISNEGTYVARKKVNEKAMGETEMESTEDIFKFWISPSNFWKLYDLLNPSKFVIDALVFQYFLGYSRK